MIRRTGLGRPAFEWCYRKICSSRDVGIEPTRGRELASAEAPSPARGRLAKARRTPGCPRRSSHLRPGLSNGCLAKWRSVRWERKKFYLLSALVSLLVYLPYLVWRPPVREALLPAFGLACLMALTFVVTTEALRRGPLGGVSSITALSPALTAILAVGLLGERLAPWGYAGMALAPLGLTLLSIGRTGKEGSEGWVMLAILSLALQGVGAFIAKLVVTPEGPSALLLMGASVQVVVGA